MTTLGFTVRFHTAFRVGAAYGRDGLDVAVDHDMVLPGDHLKGLMRAAARDVLGLSTAQIGGVFGDAVRPCVWSWSSATPEREGWTFMIRHRVQIDEQTHAATKDHIVAAEQAWTPQARFQVWLRGALTPGEEAVHSRVLRATGAAVHGLGGWRRRGLGWVGIRPDEPVTDEDLAALVAARITEEQP